MDYFKPLIEPHNFAVHKGTLSANGNMEYAANTKYINIGEIRVRDANAEYINRTADSAPKTAAKKVDKAAKEYSEAPSLAVNVDKVYINGRLGFLNTARNPQYRIFWDRCEIQISNFTNQSEDGAMVARLTGLFMGSGKTIIAVTARPNKKGPDLDLRIAIEDTDMRLMNDLFRSYGNFDVVAGRFSFFSEISVVSGKLSNPQTSTWETIVGLIQNAFFKAILPGFEREASAPRKKS